MGTRRRLPTPSRNPARTLSAQCNYRPLHTARSARLRALVDCLESQTFDYRSLAGRLNLIRNLQGPRQAAHRSIYASDLSALRDHVACTRRTRHDPRAFMTAARDQRRRLEFLFDVPLTTAHPTPAAVLGAYRGKSNDSRSPHSHHLIAARYRLHDPRDLSADAEQRARPYAVGRRRRRRRRRPASTSTSSAEEGARRRCCTVHMTLEFTLGLLEHPRRSRRRSRALRALVRRLVRPWASEDSVRVLKYPTAAAAAASGRATFGAGCFWGAEAAFRSVPGVLSTRVGYMGGHVPCPTYAQVCAGDTGHAEVVDLRFDPRVVTYDALLKRFWHSHDPTTADRQGNDVGAQYRSVIFAHGATQKRHAARSAAAEGATRTRAIVTQILDASAHVFYEAEPYHQRYLEKKAGARLGARQRH